MVAMVADGQCEMVIESDRRRDRTDISTWPSFGQREPDLDISETVQTRHHGHAPGYRVISRRLVKSLPSRAQGFEIEAELNAHSAVMDVNIARSADAIRWSTGG